MVRPLQLLNPSYARFNGCNPSAYDRLKAPSPWHVGRTNVSLQMQQMNNTVELFRLGFASPPAYYLYIRTLQELRNPGTAQYMRLFLVMIGILSSSASHRPSSLNTEATTHQGILFGRYSLNAVVVRGLYWRRREKRLKI